MFLFPWLDWGNVIDISDFEKINFFGHERFLAFSVPWKRDFFDIGNYFEESTKSVQGENFEKKNFSEFFRKFLKFEKYILGILRPRSRSEPFFRKKTRKK